MRILDQAWEKINALGGYFAPDDIAGKAYGNALGDALQIIERLGGMDPLAREQRCTTTTIDDHAWLRPARPKGA